MRAGIYIGKRPDLKGHRALVREDPGSEDSGVLAQFDSMHLKEAHSWWPFRPTDFTLEEACPD